MQPSQQYQDEILRLQILLGRLGERETFGWWRTMDATDAKGGGGFFRRFLSDAEGVFRELAAGEAVILAARQAEKSRIRSHNSKIAVQTIFCGPPEWEALLNSRWAHWKKYPSSIPEKARFALAISSGREQLISQLQESLSGIERPEFENTILGLKVTHTKKVEQDSQVIQLAKAVELSAGEWSLPYYDRNA